MSTVRLSITLETAHGSTLTVCRAYDTDAADLVIEAERDSFCFGLTAEDCDALVAVLEHCARESRRQQAEAAAAAKGAE